MYIKCRWRYRKCDATVLLSTMTTPNFRLSQNWSRWCRLLRQRWRYQTTPFLRGCWRSYSGGQAGSDVTQWPGGHETNSEIPIRWHHDITVTSHNDGLVQERRNSSALAMELRLSCTNPSISAITSRITGNSTVCPKAWASKQQRKCQRCLRRIHWSPVDSPHTRASHAEIVSIMPWCHHGISLGTSYMHNLD